MHRGVRGVRKRVGMALRRGDFVTIVIQPLNLLRLRRRWRRGKSTGLWPLTLYCSHLVAGGFMASGLNNPQLKVEDAGTDAVKFRVGRISAPSLLVTLFKGSTWLVCRHPGDWPSKNWRTGLTGEAWRCATLPPQVSVLQYSFATLELQRDLYICPSQE